MKKNNFTIFFNKNIYIKYLKLVLYIKKNILNNLKFLLAYIF